MTNANPEQVSAHEAGSSNSKKEESPVLKALNLILAKIETGYTDDKTTYALLPCGQVVRLCSQDMENWLRYTFYSDYGQTLNNRALSEALDSASSITLIDKDRWKLWIRYALEEGCLEVDYFEGDEQRVLIQPGKVTVLSKESGQFKFLRSPDMLPLPNPKGLENLDTAIEGLDRLEPFINLENKELFPLLIISVAYSIYGVTGFPIISLVGAAGSGKSEAARLLRQLIDPNKLPLSSIPSSDRDAFIEAKSMRLLTFDNIQPIKDSAISDRLAKFVTGDGWRVSGSTPV